MAMLKFFATILVNIILVRGLKFDASSISNSLSSTTSSGALTNILQKLAGKGDSILGSSGSDSDLSIPEPVLPNPGPFNISMLTQETVNGEDLKRAVPEEVDTKSGEDEDDDEDDDEDRLSDDQTSPTSQTSQEPMNILKQLLEQFEQTNRMVGEAKTVIQSAKKSLVDYTAAEAAKKAAEAQAPHAVDIKLFDSAAQGITPIPSKASSSSTEALFKLSSENVVLPIVYTRPDTASEIEHMFKCANNEVLQTVEMRIAEINMMFKSGQRTSRVRETIELLQSYVRAQKDFVETSISTLTRTMSS